MVFVGLAADSGSHLPSLALALLNHTASLRVVKEAGQRSWKLTVTVVEEFSDDGGTAGRPRAGAVDLNERG